MRSARFLVLVMAVAAASGFAVSAHAEVTVSITLSGPIEELLPILEQLRTMGVGTGNTGPTLEIHSMASASGQHPDKPPLALLNPAVEPAEAQRGTEVLVTVQCVDPDRIVDTIAVQIGELAPMDLFDNGTHGDAVGGDGLWSAKVMLDPQLPSGAVALRILAFDANGAPVTVPGPDGTAVPLAADQSVTVRE